MITKRGRRVVKLVHPDAQTTDDVFGCLRGIIKIVGDITKPVVGPDDWEALL